MDLEFTSTNPYQSLEVITGDSPQELLAQLLKINTPIKIVAIVPYGAGNRQCAYIMGDVRIKKPSVRKIKNGFNSTT